MKARFVALLAFIVPAALAQQPVPTIPFYSVPEPLKLPKDLHFDELTGVGQFQGACVRAVARTRTGQFKEWQMSTRWAAPLTLHKTRVGPVLTGEGLS